MQNWNKIEGHPKYEVSDEGHARRWSTWKNDYIILKGSDDGDGHKRLQISQNGKVIARKPIHVLVFETFVRKLKPNEVVHHISGIKNQNQLSNLQVMTKSQHIRLHNLESPRKKDQITGKFVKKNPQ